MTKFKKNPLNRFLSEPFSGASCRIRIGFVTLKVCIYLFAAYWHKKSDVEQVVSSIGDYLFSNDTGAPTPEVHNISEFHTLSTYSYPLQHNADLQNDPGHLMVTYNYGGIYICRVCNAVGCTDKNVTVSIPGMHFRTEI